MKKKWGPPDLVTSRSDQYGLQYSQYSVTPRCPIYGIWSDFSEFVRVQCHRILWYNMRWSLDSVTKRYPEFVNSHIYPHFSLNQLTMRLSQAFWCPGQCAESQHLIKKNTEPQHCLSATALSHKILLSFAKNISFKRIHLIFTRNQ